MPTSTYRRAEMARGRLGAKEPAAFPIWRAGPWNTHAMDLEGKLALVTGGAELDELWSPAAMAA
jgi:hypothetical protein